ARSPTRSASTRTRALTAAGRSRSSTPPTGRSSAPARTPDTEAAPRRLTHTATRGEWGGDRLNLPWPPVDVARDGSLQLSAKRVGLRADRSDRQRGRARHDLARRARRNRRRTALHGPREGALGRRRTRRAGAGTAALPAVRHARRLRG